MLTLYTSKAALFNDYERPNIHLVEDANSYFNQLVKKGEIREADCVFVQQMLSTDNGPLSNITDLLKLSTSCKTLILANKYPELILSTGNITKEAKLTLLTLYSGTDRAFLFYPSEAVTMEGGINGERYEEDRQILLNDGDRVDALVVTEGTVTSCHTYGDIMEEINANSTTRSIISSMYEAGMLKSQGKGEAYDANDFDPEYHMICNTRSESDFPIFISSQTCHRDCRYRVQVFNDCFVIGGQLIVTTEFDEQLEPIMAVHWPFNIEPTEQQLDLAFDYFEKLRYGEIRETRADEDEFDESIVTSQELFEHLNVDFKRTHLIYYSLNKNGAPCIENIVYYADESEIERLEKLDKANQEALHCFLGNDYDFEDLDDYEFDEEEVDDP